MANYIYYKKKYIFILLIILLSYNQFSADFFRVKQDIMNNFKKKILGVYINSSLEINNLGYSSNIYSYDSSKKADYTSEYQFSLSTAIILRNKFIIKIEDSPSYTYYNETSEERDFFNNFALSFFSYIGRLNINYSFKKSYINTIPTEEFGIRLRRDDSDHFISIDYGNLNHFYMNVFFRSQNLEYKDLLYLNTFDISILMNRKENTIGISLNKRIFTSTRISFGINYFEHKFLYSFDRDSSGINTFFSVSFRNRGKLTGDLRLGLKYFNSNNIVFKDYLTPFGFGQVNFRILNGLTLISNYLMDISYSFTGRDVYYKNNSFGIGFNYRFNRQFRVEYFSRFGTLHYRYLTYGFKYREDLSFNHRITLRYFLNPQVQIGVFMSRFNSTSTDLFYNRNVDFFGGFLRFNL